MTKTFNITSLNGYYDIIEYDFNSSFPYELIED